MNKEYRKPAYSIRKLEDMTQAEREEYEEVMRQIKEEKKNGIPVSKELYARQISIWKVQMD